MRNSTPVRVCSWSLWVFLLAACAESEGKDPGPGDSGLLPEGPVIDQAPPDLDPGMLDGPLMRPDGPMTLGQPCTSEVDCSEGLICDSDLPGGMCTRECEEDTDCQDPSKRGCLDGRCHPRCDPRILVNPCRESYVCRVEGPRALCVADCREVGCAAGVSCHTQTGLCVDPGSGVFGDICGAEEGGCEGTPNGICFTISRVSSGFCTVPCAPFTTPCPDFLDDARCLLGTGTSAYCAIPCQPAQSSPCPSPQMSCVPMSGGVNVCLP